MARDSASIVQSEDELVLNQQFIHFSHASLQTLVNLSKCNTIKLTSLITNFNVHKTFIFVLGFK